MSCSAKFEIKLVELPLKIDFAKDKALLACTFALFVQLANREFFLDLEIKINEQNELIISNLFYKNFKEIKEKECFKPVIKVKILNKIWKTRLR